MNATIIGSELLLATATTSIIANGINAEPLVTAAIGFGVSVITMVGGELIKFLVAFFKSKREKIEKGDKKDV